MKSGITGDESLFDRENGFQQASKPRSWLGMANVAFNLWRKNNEPMLKFRENVSEGVQTLTDPMNKGLLEDRADANTEEAPATL